MAFDWNEYLKLARFLKDEEITSCNKEAVYRSAVSRSYYSAFCFARNYAQENLGYEPTGDNQDHPGVRNHYRSYRMNNIARYLDDLRGWRNECDYDDEINDPADPLNLVAYIAIERAEKLFNLLT